MGLRLGSYTLAEMGWFALAVLLVRIGEDIHRALHVPNFVQDLPGLLVGTACLVAALRLYAEKIWYPQRLRDPRVNREVRGS